MAGWGMTPLCVEVGTRGEINKTWGEMSKGLAMTKAESKRLKLKCSKIALRCSYFLYLSRKEKVWQAHKLLQHGGSERTVLPTQQTQQAIEAQNIKQNARREKEAQTAPPVDRDREEAAAWHQSDRMPPQCYDND